VTLFKAVAAIDREVAAIVKERKSQLGEMEFDAKIRVFPVEFMEIKLLSEASTLARIVVEILFLALFGQKKIETKSRK